MYLFKIFLITISFIGSLSAFTFDKWKSGDSFEQVLRLAQDNNISLANEGVKHDKKYFHWDLLKEKEKYKTFYYYDVIFGERAKVVLSFTDQSKELYLITIQWNFTGKNSTEFKEALFGILDKKYNIGKKKFQNDLTKNIFYKYREWHYDDHTIINSRSSSHNVEIIYFDSMVKEVETKKEKLNISVDDAVKF